MEERYIFVGEGKRRGQGDRLVSNNQPETRQERREKKLRKKKEQIQQHGKGLATIYKQAVLKRTGKGKAQGA